MSTKQRSTVLEGGPDSEDRQSACPTAAWSGLGEDKVDRALEGGRAVSKVIAGRGATPVALYDDAGCKLGGLKPTRRQYRWVLSNTMVFASVLAQSPRRGPTV